MPSIRDLPVGDPQVLAQLKQRLQGWDIHIVGYCHADWAWVHSRAWHEIRYVRSIDEVLDLLAAGSPYRWCLDVYHEHLIPYIRLRPERLAELRQRVADGSIDPTGGAYSGVRPGVVEDETLVRALVYGRRRFAELMPEFTPEVYFNADTAVGPSTLPQVLQLAGYSAYRFWRPQSAMDAKGIPREFRWTGLDGTTIRATRQLYGVWLPSQSDVDAAASFAELAQRFVDTVVEPQVQFGGATFVLLFEGGDDTRPLRRGWDDELIDAPAFIDRWNAEGLCAMRFNTVTQYVRDTGGTSPELAEVQGVIEPCEVSYNSAYHGVEGVWRTRQRADRELVQAELWSAMAAMDGAAYPQDQLDALWEQFLACAPHAIQHLWEEDFRDNVARAGGAEAGARHLGRVARERLALDVRVPVDAADPAQAAVVVFNPHAWTHPLPIEFHMAYPVHAMRADRMGDHQGHALAHQQLTAEHPGNDPERTTSEQDVLVSLAGSDVPGLGWTTFTFHATEAQTQATPAKPALDMMVENNRIVQLTDPDRAWWAGPGPGGPTLGGVTFYGFERGDHLNQGPIVDISLMDTESLDQVADGPVAQIWHRKACTYPHEVTQEIRLFKELPAVQWNTTIRAGEADNGVFTLDFPLSIGPQPTLHADACFGVEQRDLLREPYTSMTTGGTGRDYERRRPGQMTAKSFVDVSCPGRCGASVISADGDRYWWWEQASATMRHVLVQMIGPEGRQFFYDRCAPSLEARGVHRFRHLLVLHGGDWREAGIVRLAEAFRRPPTVVPVPLPRPADACHRPARGSLVALTPNDHVAVRALYQDAGRTVVRLLETLGQPADVELTWPTDPGPVEVVNFHLDPVPGPSVQVHGRSIRTSMTPWQIVTLAIESA